jgi:hypothetical protein
VSSTSTFPAGALFQRNITFSGIFSSSCATSSINYATPISLHVGVISITLRRLVRFSGQCSLHNFHCASLSRFSHIWPFGAFKPPQLSNPFNFPEFSYTYRLYGVECRISSPVGNEVATIHLSHTVHIYTHTSTVAIMSLHYTTVIGIRNLSACQPLLLMQYYATWIVHEFQQSKTLRNLSCAYYPFTTTDNHNSIIPHLPSFTENTIIMNNITTLT